MTWPAGCDLHIASEDHCFTVIYCLKAKGATNGRTFLNLLISSVIAVTSHCLYTLHFPGPALLLLSGSYIRPRPACLRGRYHPIPLPCCWYRIFPGPIC